MAEPEQESENENSRIILYEGYLSKKGQINRSWKKRYFVLFSDKKLAYYASKEVSHLAAINELNLSTVKELSLLPFSNNPPKQRSKSRAKSFADIFIKKDATPTNNNNNNNSNNNTLSSNYDSSDNDETEKDDKEQDEHTNNNNENTECEMYVDAPINTRSICNKRNAFDIITEKRSYWLHCTNVQQLNEWIIHLKYAIFGNLILNGYLTHKTKRKLKTKWKRRFIEVYQSKIIRIYKDNKKTKVKQQIDIDEHNVSIIKYGQNKNKNKTDPNEKENENEMPNIIEIYDYNENLTHIFSAKTAQIRHEFMDSFYLTMNAYKINILCEGYLHFRAEDAKYWKKSYFALIEGALIAFKSEILCNEFKNSIYSCDDFYNKAFHKYINKSMPMIDPQIEKKSYDEIDNKNKYKYSATQQLLQTLKIFTVTTTVGKWYFGAEEATQFLFWCQSFHTFCKSKNMQHKNRLNNTLFSDKDYDEKDMEQKANSTEPRFMMDINEDLIAINDEYEYDNDSKDNMSENEAAVTVTASKKLNKRLSGNILMAVNLDKRSQTMRDLNLSNSKSNPIACKHRSRSLSLKPFTTQELMEDDIDTMDEFSKFDVDKHNSESKEDELKNGNTGTGHDDKNSDEYVYSDDETSDEYDKDCLETTIYDNSEHKLRKHTMTNFIVDDEY